MTTRVGHPRVGETVVLRIAGSAEKAVVTQVAARLVRSGAHTSAWSAIKTDRFGWSPYRRRAGYFIED